MSGRRRGSGRRRKKPVDATAFWGSEERLDLDIPIIDISDQPHAVVASLGTPPLPGRETAAEATYVAVYDKAAGLATALAAAAGQLRFDGDDDGGAFDGDDDDDDDDDLLDGVQG